MPLLDEGVQEGDASSLVHEATSPKFPDGVTPKAYSRGLQHPRCPLNRRNCSWWPHVVGAEPLPPPNPNRGERPDPKTRDHSSALPSDLWVSRTGVASPKTSQAAQGRLALVASLPTSCPSFPADRQTSLAALSPAARDFLPLQSRHTARVPPQPEEEEGPRGSAGAPPPAALGAGSQSIPHAHGAHCSIMAQGVGKKKIIQGRAQLLLSLIGERRHGPDLKLRNCASSQSKQFPKLQHFRFLFERK